MRGKCSLQRGDQAQRRGGLAVVLARGGDENAWVVVFMARILNLHSALTDFDVTFESSFARQLRIRARIQFLVIGGLHADDGGDAENVVRVRAA